MKAILTLFITLVPIMAFAINTELAIFDEAQKSDERMYENIGKIWKQNVPQHPTYYEELTKLNKISNKLERIIFIYKLENEPTSIRMNSWSDWVHPINSLTYNKLEIIKKSYPEYEELDKAYRKQEFHVRMLNSTINDKVSEYKSDVIEKIKQDFFTEQVDFKKKWDALKNSK